MIIDISHLSYPYNLVFELFDIISFIIHVIWCINKLMIDHKTVYIFINYHWYKMIF